MSTWAHYDYRVRETVIICLRGNGVWDLPGERHRLMGSGKMSSQAALGGYHLHLMQMPDLHPSLPKAFSPCWEDGRDFHRPEHRAL